MLAAGPFRAGRALLPSPCTCGEGSAMNRAVLRSLLVAAAVAAAAPAMAQDYPNRPVTIMVGLAAGGITDVTARLYAEAVSPGSPASASRSRTAPARAVASPRRRCRIRRPTAIRSWCSPARSTPPCRRSGTATYEPVKGFSPITYLFNSVVVLTVPADSPAKTMKELHEMGPQEAGRAHVRHAGARLAVAPARRQDIAG